MSEPPAIFISYRRIETVGHARSFHLYLCQHFTSEAIFFDLQSIESGDKFPERLSKAVAECRVLLALIGPDWLEVRNKTGVRRLDDPNDFVRQEISQALSLDKKVIPVLFDDTPPPSKKDLPEPLKGLAERNVHILRGNINEYKSQLAELVRLLEKVPGVPQPLPDPGSASPDACWPETPPDIRWPMADHSGVREAFATLLTRASPWRFLPVRGPSETGKSHITRQMLGNALCMSDLACGRFDFKGGTDMDAEVRTFVQELGVPQPPKGKLLVEQLRHILDALLERKSLALLIFDTYEAAGKFEQDWVEKELLTKLVRAPWLRVVIAGQCVPEHARAIWESVARTTLDVVTPPPIDWYDYGKQHHPDLQPNDVETVWRLAKKKASLLEQMLGPEDLHEIRGKT